MSQTNTTPVAVSAPPGVPVSVSTPGERFARHVRDGLKGLRWHFALGQLALECCPVRMPDRTVRLQALADDNPPCSLSLLFKVTKFARQYRRAEVLRLARAGLGWDQLAVLLSVPRAARGAALDEVIRLKLTSRQVRLWKAERYGTQLSRGRRTTTPIRGHSPEVQARALINDCRRMCGWHENTAGVFEETLRAVEAGATLAPEELTQFRVAVEALRALAARVGNLRALAERITAACE